MRTRISVLIVSLMALWMLVMSWLQPRSPDVIYEKGKSFLDAGDCDLAISVLNRAVEVDPKMARAHSATGLAHTKKVAHQQAIADFSRAIQLEPEDSDNYLERGHAYEFAGDYRNAYRNYVAAARISLMPQTIGHVFVGFEWEV